MFQAYLISTYYLERLQASAPLYNWLAQRVCWGVVHCWWVERRTFVKIVKFCSYLLLVLVLDIILLVQSGDF